MNKNVPQIRFQGFHDDWEQRKLGEVADNFEYGLNASSKEYDGKNKYIRITDIDENSRLFKKDSLTTPDTDLNKAENFKLKAGDVLFARTGASVGKTYRYNLNDGVVYFAGFLIRARFKDGICSDFIYQNTLTNKYKKYIKVMSQRSGQPGVNAQEYANFNLSIPVKDEQIKIGSFINRIDSLITLHQRKLNLLQKQKKSLLQKMFPKKDEKIPEIRFNGFTDDWEQRKFGDILKIFDRKSTIDNEYTVLSSTNSGMEYRQGRVSSSSNKGYKIIEIGDLVLSPQNLWLGNININSLSVGLVSPSYKTFKFINVNPGFIRPQLKSERMIWNYKSVSTQGASVVRRNLELDEFYKIKLLVPKHNEQNQLEKLFATIDNLITLHQRKLDAWQEQKKGLLQKMFV